MYADLDESKQSLTIISPEYTETSHDVYLNIHYVVIAPGDSKVHVAYDTLAIGAGVDLSVYDGIFTKKLISNFSGFEATPQNVASMCGGVLTLGETLPKITFTTPLYNYHNSKDLYMDCFMFFRSPAGKQVKLTITRMVTVNEIITIFNHPSSSSSLHRVNTLSGIMDSPLQVISSRGGLTLIFDDRVFGLNGPGIEGDLQILDSVPSDEPGFCGGVVTLSERSPVFTFSTPHYNNPASSDIYMACRMYFTCPQGHQVQFNIQGMETKSDANNGVTIYDHPSSTSNTYMAAHLSGVQPDTHQYYISSRAGFTITYDDIDAVDDNGKGMLAEARIVDGIQSGQTISCGGTIPLDDELPLVFFSTPTFHHPLNIDADNDCVVYITSTPGKQVQLTLNQVATTPNEVIKVYDHPTDSRDRNLVLKAQGTLTQKVSVYSTSGGLILTYTDSSTGLNGPGFLAEAFLLDEVATYQSASCGGSVILSDSFPRVYATTPFFYHSPHADMVIECRWYLISQSNQQINLTLKDIDMRNEVLSIYDHPTLMINQVGTVAQTTDEVSLKSEQRGFIMDFADESPTENGRGFFFYARLEGTEGNITIPDEPIQSTIPNEPIQTTAITTSKPNTSPDLPSSPKS
ncbi:uncharacterized protein LOC135153628 [Lytechinus pictus]|uniref:uncharacterized protein LOC135153628 n=1 Tax=Lytechinus pictus TaxID=7653 RepID=UPI0030B9E3CB